MVATGYHVDMSEPRKIPGFTYRGDFYRSGVALSEKDAAAVADLAAREDAPVGTVLRRLVRKGLGRKDQA